MSKLIKMLLLLAAVISLASCATYNSNLNIPYVGKSLKFTKDVYLSARTDWHLRNPGTVYFVFNPELGGLDSSFYRYKFPTIAEFKHDPKRWQEWRGPRGESGNKLTALLFYARYRTVALLAKGTRFHFVRIYNNPYIAPRIEIDSGAYKGYVADFIYPIRDIGVHDGKYKFLLPHWASEA